MIYVLGNLFCWRHSVALSTHKVGAFLAAGHVPKNNSCVVTSWTFPVQGNVSRGVFKIRLFEHGCSC